MGIIILQRTVLQIPYDGVDTRQIFEALLDVVLLPDLLVEPLRFVDESRVLGIDGDALGTALAGYALAVLLRVVRIIVRLLPLYIVLLRGGINEVSWWTAGGRLDNAYLRLWRNGQSPWCSRTNKGSILELLVLW